MTQLRQREKDLTNAGIKVNVVTFDSRQYAKSYVQQAKLPWPVLCDPEKTLYSAYRMRNTSWWALTNPVAIFKYTMLMIAGIRLGRPGSDVKQLGGDVLVSPDGIVQMHFVSREPHDRPSVASILNIASGN